ADSGSISGRCRVSASRLMRALVAEASATSTKLMPTMANSVSIISTTMRMTPRRRSPARFGRVTNMIGLLRAVESQAARSRAGSGSGVAERQRLSQVLHDADLPGLLGAAVPDADGHLDGPDADLLACAVLVQRDGLGRPRRVPFRVVIGPPHHRLIVLQR